MAVRGDALAVTNALDDIRKSLAVDGYRLDVAEATTERLRVAVTATEHACAECLAPAEVIKMIISGGLAAAYAPDEIDLALPPTGAH